ncbi:aldehyde dehydrogenase [Patulibacter minatonensis]|uniref:aldehyde dehydrogenase n=1 Tax=Patulibacter minatonensis TaxID=298163 RepID=UPI00068871AB|nr:aldehyde dehydrogenase [Patulibacter minatonensis]
MSTVAELEVTYDTLYIGGEWVPPTGSERITITSPSTLQQIGSVPDGTEQDIDVAVTAARRAFDDPSGWSRWSAEQRQETLNKLADAMDARAEDSALRTSSQNGMPVAISRAFEGPFPGMVLRYYADLATKQDVEERRPGLLGGTSIVRRTPIGVVGAIVPWNFPQAITFLKLAPLLAAGCTVVLKPSPETTLDAYTIAEAAEAAGVPAGVINIVQGGREVGAYLVQHPGIDKVSFTGSTAAGRKIGEVCGRLLRPVTLELGGKSAAIVLDDADLVGNMEALFGSMLINNGQTCWLNSRILAPKSRYDDVVETLSALANGVTIGNPLDDGTQIGPLVSQVQRERVEGYIQKGKDEGARVAAGGGRPDGLDGYFVQPTIFADVDRNSAIAQEEIFGPVLSVIQYDDEDDAIAIANGTEYGLGGTVWTQDQERGLAVARRVQTGSIGINHYVNDPAAPFGGVKSSGLGRELGPEGLAHYQALQTVYLDPPAAG